VRIAFSRSRNSRVFLEAVQRVPEALASLLHRLLDPRDGQSRPRRDHPSIEQDVRAIDLEPLPLLDTLEDLGSHRVHDPDAPSSKDEGADVRVHGRDRGGRVDHYLDAGGGKGLRAHAVHVCMVDDSDVVAAQALDQVLGPVIESRCPGDAHGYAFTPAASRSSRA
jgi:hypothetical protein